MKPLLRYSLETGVLEYLAIVFKCLVWYLFGTPTWKITGKEVQRNLFPYLGYLGKWRIFWRGCLLPISSVVEPPWLFNVWTMDFQIFGKRQYSNYFFKSRLKQYGSIVNLTKCTIIFFKIVFALFLSLINVLSVFSLLMKAHVLMVWFN